MPTSVYADTMVMLYHGTAETLLPLLPDAAAGATMVVLRVNEKRISSMPMRTLPRWRKWRLFLVGLCNPWLAVPRVCTFSALFWDIHDYTVTKGGDGTPSHFYTYICWKCGKAFTI